ncbi:NAD(P)-dependent oxidoreductase [Sporolactobacillus shoreicorticis]|uniref:NAD-dependent epimerase/dehydratase family protein n=1 Tax=Sporolactobacillus shoreicorticis TaxID=1923877 RepID=A0ABW5S132_9BACL|nr:NAD(P)-dependent oxidoreductase [Sporolactobacillus shoreicorticis]MCO7125324.1 NAD(P)-dependent oxidoreductase [Sporolactobacillus shoreicorticis]
MKAIVFGGNGFIGSHVVEQLHHAGHEVTAVVRFKSDTNFLEQLGVNVVNIDYSNPSQINLAMKGKDIAYNCTASQGVQATNTEPTVEIVLTKRLAESAAATDVRHFVQLSSIIIYGFEKEGVIDENYEPIMHYSIQTIQQKRERIVKEIGKRTGMLTTIVRPAGTIGVRGERSSFARFFKLNQSGHFPIIGKGEAVTSFIDTRDIGRAMTFLGAKKIVGTYLLKGFDVTWMQLKNMMDEVTGRQTNYVSIPKGLNAAQLSEQGIDGYAYHTFSVSRIWDDSKLRNQGFHSVYSFQQAVESEVAFLSEKDGF